MRFITLFQRAYKRAKSENPIIFFCRLIKVLVIQSIIFGDNLSRKMIKLRARNRYVVKEILGSKMYLDLKNDTGISYDLYKAGIREPYITKTIQKEIKKGDVVVDIGANIGYYALLEARLVGKEGKVYAIEPVPKNMELLKRNIKINGYSNIEPFQLAIGDKNKTDYIFISQKSNWSSMLKSPILAPTIIGKLPVQVITLDKFLEDKPWPDLIRMDVEGYEIKIIKGMRQLLNSHKSLKIIIEIHPYIVGNDKMKRLLTILMNSGFKVKVVTYEPDPWFLYQSKFVKRIINILANRTRSPLRFGYLNLSIDDLIRGKFFGNRKMPCLEILFERK